MYLFGHIFTLAIEESTEHVTDGEEDPEPPPTTQNEEDHQKPHKHHAKNKTAAPWPDAVIYYRIAKPRDKSLQFSEFSKLNVDYLASF